MLVAEVHMDEWFRRLDDKMELIRNDIKQLNIRLAEQTILIDQNTRDLTEHKEGVIQCRKRIDTLERTSDRLGWLWNALSAVIALVASLVAILKFWT